MKIWILSLVLLTGLFLVPVSASAAECEGVSYPATTTVAGQKLVLNGLGLRQATIFNVNVYVAALYVPKKSKNPKVLLDLKTPKKIVLTFVRNVSKKKVVGAYQSNLDRAPDSIRAEITPGYNKIMKNLQGIEKGQTQVFTYIPNKGLKIETRGKLRATLTNPVAIKYYLGLYMGTNPPFQGLRDGLVGGSCP